MENGNNLLDEFLQQIRNTPRGTTLKAPWGSMPLDDEGQAAAAALIHFGIIGMSGNGGIYMGRENAGKPFYRLLHGWILYAMVLAYIAFLAVVAKNHSDLATWAGISISALIFVYASIHFDHAKKHVRLFISGLGRMGEVARLGAISLAFFASTGALAGLIFGRLV